MADKLRLYNAALRHIGELKLSSLTENREPRRVLDDVYDDGFVNDVLEQAYWKFASRSVKLDKDASVTPTFGYRFAFSKPADFVHIMQVASDEYFNVPLLRMSDEGNFIFADLDEIFIQYVSNGTTFGNDLSRWPESFTRYVELYLATQIVERLTQNSSKHDTLLALTKRAKTYAKSKDAIKNPTRFPPTGEWVLSRGGNAFHGGRRDGGHRGGLLG